MKTLKLYLLKLILGMYNESLDRKFTMTVCVDKEYLQGIGADLNIFHSAC